MDCPQCHAALLADTTFGRAIDWCRSCGGRWLDATQLGPLVRQSTPAPQTDPARRGCTPGLNCPRCQRPLTPFNYAHDSGVYINRCAHCDGIWLERGQLALLVQYRLGTPATRALADAWSEKLQARNRIRFAKGLLRSRALSASIAVALVTEVVLRTGDLHLASSLAVSLLLPLICIWFADAVGNLTGMRLFGLSRPVINRTTPGDFVAIGGWILLLARVAASLMLRG